MRFSLAQLYRHPPTHRGGLSRAKLGSWPYWNCNFRRRCKTRFKCGQPLHARSLEEEARVLLEAALASAGPQSDKDHPKQLTVLDDAQLWRVARQRVPDEQSERMQELVERRQREGFSAEEAAEADRLQAYAQTVMRLRAEAAALLERRGFDISSLLTSS